jgi:hypothetical protein
LSAKRYHDFSNREVKMQIKPENFGMGAWLYLEGGRSELLFERVKTIVTSAALLTLHLFAEVIMQ